MSEIKLSCNWNVSHVVEYPKFAAATGAFLKALEAWIQRQPKTALDFVSRRLYNQREWWQEGFLRVPAYTPVPCGFSKEGEAPCPDEISCEVITFTKTRWYNPPHDEVYTAGKGWHRPPTHVRGVHNAIPYKGGTVFDTWRCSKCRVCFIVGDLMDLHHSCTRPE